ncbi:EAL and HDOD domain-containing protein [Ningiella sp. W23]|uniref:EAL and HDOD domain-containing protein n=1 Tax=Ningiella sp. W23 TaxID=3023715 RepID=UPI00375638BE
MLIFAREPIFDIKQRLFAYQLVFRDSISGELPLAQGDVSQIACNPESTYPQVVEHAKVETFKDSSTAIILDDLLQGFVSLISVSRAAIESDILDQLSIEDTILELSDDSIDESYLGEAISILKSKGFRIALLNQHDLRDEHYRAIDFLKVDVNHISLLEFKQLQAHTENYKCKIIASKIENHEQFEKCVNAGFDFFQGHFFLARQHTQHEDLPANKLSLLRLLAQTADSSINMEAIRETFEHDATLSYLLMRFINNPMVNKSHQITSIKHALTYLGEVMLRKFVAIISIAQLNQDKVQELLQVSLVRAKYCELLDMQLGKEKQAMTAFMTGLFSLIDVILDRDMAHLLAQIPVSPLIKQALLKQEGEYHDLLSSVKALESSNWLKFKALAKTLGLSQEQLHQHYLEAVQWNNSMMTATSDMFPRAKAS